jgi:hypothetical protein
VTVLDVLSYPVAATQQSAADVIGSIVVASAFSSVIAPTDTDVILNVMTSALCASAGSEKSTVAVRLDGLASRTLPLRIFVDGSTITRKTSIIFYTKVDGVIYLLNSTLPLKGEPQWQSLADSSGWTASVPYTVAGAPSTQGVATSDRSEGGINGSWWIATAGVSFKQTEHLILHPRGFSQYNAIEYLANNEGEDYDQYVSAKYSNLHNTASVIMYKPFVSGALNTARNHAAVSGWWLAAAV